MCVCVPVLIALGSYWLLSFGVFEVLWLMLYVRDGPNFVKTWSYKLAPEGHRQLMQHHSDPDQDTERKRIVDHAKLCPYLLMIAPFVVAVFAITFLYTLPLCGFRQTLSALWTLAIESVESPPPTAERKKKKRKMDWKHWN
jgi:hypothetical protein